ncbi:MAG TPA: (Fe-S)-binding protein [bacterium]
MAQDDKAQGGRVAAGLSWRQLIELEACARCGECKGWCPVYTQDAREAICARGKLDGLRGLVRGSLSEGERSVFLESLYECSACGQCHVVCPVRIDTPELWEQARLALGRAGFPRPESQTRALAGIKRHNNSYAKPQAERGLWAERAWQAGLLLAPVRLWRERPAPVLYFAGCTGSLDPAMQFVAVLSARLLQEAGVDFAILGPDEPCCASKLRRMGDETFPQEAAQRIELLRGLGAETIVASCAGCFKGLHGDFARLPGGVLPVLHLTQMLDRLIAAGRLPLRHAVPLRVTYHDPCHLGRHSQIYEEPRRVLAAVPGLEFVELARAGAFSSCCGMGGGLKLANEGLQHRMGAHRIREAEATGASAIVTPCQTCCIGLANGVKETGSPLRVMHLNEVLARAVCPEITPEKVAAALAAGG